MVCWLLVVGWGGLLMVRWMLLVDWRWLLLRLPCTIEALLVHSRVALFAPEPFQVHDGLVAGLGNARKMQIGAVQL